MAASQSCRPCLDSRPRRVRSLTAGVALVRQPGPRGRETADFVKDRPTADNLLNGRARVSEERTPCLVARRCWHRCSLCWYRLAAQRPGSRFPRRPRTRRSMGRPPPPAATDRCGRARTLDVSIHVLIRRTAAVATSLARLPRSARWVRAARPASRLSFAAAIGASTRSTIRATAADVRSLASMASFADRADAQPPARCR
jgi:hypothetical protein